MTSILTLTMNPCVDVSTRTERVVPEHKLRCEMPRHEPGGGGVNVARVLHRLGAPCLAYFPCGGSSGAQLQALLRDEGVPFLAEPVAGATRESWHVRAQAQAQDFRFVMPGPPLSPIEWQACLKALPTLARQVSHVVLSGSLPPGVPEDFYASAIQSLRALGCAVVLDASGPALAHALEVGVMLVKPSLRELRDLTGHALAKPSDWLAAARQLVQRGQAQVVVLSLGGQGALLVSAETQWYAPALPVPVSTTVGAGDSFVAGLVQALAAGCDLRAAFTRGVAAASAALLGQGTGLCQAHDVWRLEPQVRVQDSLPV